MEWFTANRTATVKAGSFAVIRTGENLSVELDDGVGTQVDGVAENTINTLSGYKLTDASFNHLSLDEGKVLPIITPDNPRDNILKATPVKSATDQLLVRDADAHVYTAFTWDMTFTVKFSEAATKAQGLFLDLSSNETYMHEKIVFPDDNGEEAGTNHTITSTEAGTDYYTTEDCSGDPVTLSVDQSIDSTTPYYKLAPSKTGTAFRIAFVPTAIGGTGTVDSTAYAKIWADNEGNDENEGRFVSTNTVGNLLTPESYDKNTIKLSGHDNNAAYTAETGAGTAAVQEPATPATQMVFMKYGDNTGVPGDNTIKASAALTTKSNYLAYFALNPGKTVSITFTCVAWYEGTHPDIDDDADDFENIVASMKFSVANLKGESEE